MQVLQVIVHSFRFSRRSRIIMEFTQRTPGFPHPTLAHRRIIALIVNKMREFNPVGNGGLQNHFHFRPDGNRHRNLRHIHSLLAYFVKLGDGLHPLCCVSREGFSIKHFIPCRRVHRITHHTVQAGLITYREDFPEP